MRPGIAAGLLASLAALARRQPRREFIDQRRQIERAAPRRSGGHRSFPCGLWIEERSDVRADLREDCADAGAQEDQGGDGDDGDQRQDESVLGETLPFLLAENAGQPGHEIGHCLLPPFLEDSRPETVVALCRWPFPSPIGRRYQSVTRT